MRRRLGTAVISYCLLAPGFTMADADAQTIRPSDTGNGYVLYGEDGTYQGRLTERNSGGLNILGSDGTWHGKIVPNDLGGFDVRTPDGSTEGAYDPAEGSYAPGVDYGDGE